MGDEISSLLDFVLDLLRDFGLVENNRVDDFLANEAKGTRIQGAHSIAELVAWSR